MFSKFFVDVQTDDSTTSRAQAMRWYRGGHDIEVWRNGRLVLVMNAMGI